MDSNPTLPVAVRLFGAFRDVAQQPMLHLTLRPQATVADLRAAFAAVLDDDNARALLASSAFATDERVLDEDDPVPEGTEIAVLPPVCGG